METRYVAYDRLGARRGVLPNPLEISVNKAWNGLTTLTMHYDRMSPNHEFLENDPEVAVETLINGSWVEIRDGRLKCLSVDFDHLEEVPTRTYEFLHIGEGLKGVLVYNRYTLPLTDEGKVNFGKTNVGKVLDFIWSKAELRGWTGFTRTFTATTDSAGQPWANEFTISYDVNQNMLSIVNSFIAMGLIDMVWDGRELSLYNRGYLGVNLSTGTNPLRFVGTGEYNAVDAAPERQDQSSLATHVVIIGENGLQWEFPTNTIVPEGRREVVQSYSGVDDVGTAEILAAPLILKAQNHLKNTTRQFHLTPKSKWLPFINYDVGNWADVQRGTAIENLQIIAINIQVNQNGTQGYVTLGDKIDGLLETMYARIQGLTGGVANEGGKPPTPSPRKPGTPTGLTVTTSAYVDETGKTVGRAALGWTHDYKDIYNEPVDIREFRAYYRVVGETKFRPGFVTSELSDIVSPLQVYDEYKNKITYEFHVVAVSTKGVISADSVNVQAQMNEDSTPPPKPTPPGVSVWLRVPLIKSDGKGLSPSNVVVDMPSDHDRTIVWTADNSQMLNKTELGRIKGATSITDIQRPAGSTRWYALQAYDYTGNMSAMSDAVSMTPTDLVSETSITDALNDIHGDIGANTQATADAAAKAQKGVDDAATAKAAADAAALDAANADLAAGEAQGAADAAQKRADDLWAKGTNLLADAGFEDGKLYANSLATVDLPLTEAIKIVTDTTKAHSGTKYLEMTLPAGTSTTAYMKPIPVSPDRTYRIGFWVYPETITSGKNFGMPFHWVDKDNSIINNTWPLLYYWADFGSKLIAGQWQYVTADITPPAGAVLMGTRFYLDNTNTTTKVRFDDVMVSDITEAVAAQATADAAKASAATALGTAITGQAYSLNPSFEDWTGSLPDKFLAYGTGPTKETTLVRLGSNAARFNCTDTTTSRGFNWNGILDHAPNLEYFAVEIVFRLESGNLVGAGVLLDWIGLTPYRDTVNLSAEFPNPDLHKWYKLTKVLRRPTNATGTWTGMDGYFMANFPASYTGGSLALKDLIVDWLNVRPATNEEITAYGAPALITAVDTKATAAQGDATKALSDAAAAKSAADAAAAAATAAQSTADGKNTVSPNAPVAIDADNKPVNALWTQVVGGKVIGAWYKSTPTTRTWTPMPFDPVMIPQINIGTGTFGDLDGVRLTAKTVGAAALTVGDFTNLLEDGNFEVVDPTPWTLYDDAVIQNDSGRGNTTALRCMTPASRTNNISAQQFKRPLKAGDKYFVKFKMYHNSVAPTSTTDIRATAWYKKIDGASAGSAHIIGAPVGDSAGWKDYVSGEMTVPANTEWMDFQLNVSGAYSGTVVWDDVWLIRKVGTVHIEKGAVTADRVNTNEFFADSGVVGKLNAQTATFLTNQDGSGMKSVVTGQGLKVTFTGDDGVENDRIKIGTWDEDSIAISDTTGSVVSTMDNKGTVTGRSVEASDTLYYKGTELYDYVDTRPRGMAAWGQVPVAGNMSCASGTEIGLFELAWDGGNTPSRMYEFVVNEFLAYSYGSGTVALILRMTTDGTAPTTSSPVIARYYQQCTGPGYIGLSMSRIIGSTNGSYIRVLASLYASNQGGAYVHSVNQYLYSRVMDLGVNMDPNAIATTGGGTPVSGGTVSSPATAKITKTDTFEYKSVESYLANGAHYNYNNTKGYQGQSPAGYGNLSSQYGFNTNFQSLLSGATINGIWVYVYFEHWFYSGGGTARIRLHNNLAAPSTNVGMTGYGMDSANWPIGSGRWVAVPSSLWSGFASGAYKGFGLQGDSSYNTYGIANNAAIRIKYTK